MTAVEGVIYLCRCAVNEQIPDREIVEGLDLDAVYRESSRHMISAMVGMALKDCGVETASFKIAIAEAQRKTVTLNYEMAIVCQELQNAGIWYVVLKGAVLKDYYLKLPIAKMGFAP